MRCIRQKKINSFVYDDLKFEYSYTMYVYCVMSDQNIELHPALIECSIFDGGDSEVVYSTFDGRPIECPYITLNHNESSQLQFLH